MQVGAAALPANVQVSILEARGEELGMEWESRAAQQILAVDDCGNPVTTTTTNPTTTNPTTTNPTTSPTPTNPPPGASIVLQSNDPNYGKNEVMADLETITAWAGDQNRLNAAQKAEVVAAILSGAARYYPELPTKVICRIVLANIRTESDFNVTALSGGEFAPQSSWGLLQVTPYGSAQMLTLFKQHANVLTHNFTYGMPDTMRAGIKGPLLDYATGKMIDLGALSQYDLYRPWINIHLTMWAQSNLARTSSQDPWYWKGINDYSWAMKYWAVNPTTSSVMNKYKSLLKGASIPLTIRSGLGSWVAGPATSNGYLTSNDNLSLNYLNIIMRGVRAIYNIASPADMPKAWLDTYTLNAGLIDYV